MKRCQAGAATTMPSVSVAMGLKLVLPIQIAVASDGV